MTLLDRHTFPNGGWQWYEPQTGWSAPTPKSSTFDQTCVLIIKHRMANRAIATKHNLPLDIASVAAALEAYTRKRLGLADVPIPKSEAPGWVSRLPGAVAAVANVAAGATSLYAWTQEGEVVPKDKAEARAAVCVQCPLNGKGDWTRIFTKPATDLIRAQLGAKNDMELKTSKDEDLGVCEACMCPLKLKIFSPIRLILDKMKPEQKVKLWQNCWILAEEKQAHAG